MSVMSLTRPPLPPFTFETAVQKVRRAEDAWNTCNPEQVSLAYTVDSYWRNRAEFIQGRTAIISRAASIRAPGRCGNATHALAPPSR